MGKPHEPTLPPWSRVSIGYSGQFRFIAQCSTSHKETRLGFKHICYVHGGESHPRASGYILPLTSLSDFVDYIRAQGSYIIPNPELEKPLLSTADELGARLDELGAREFPHEMYPFQRDGAEFLTTHDRAFLFDEMGLGKTVQALAAIPDGGRGIVVCPASLRLNWQREGQKWRPDITWTVCRKPKDCRFPELCEFVIMSPEAMTRWNMALYDRGWNNVTLIVDEAHYYKTATSKRTKAMSALSDACARVWGLTGTPMTNNPEDLIGILRCFALFKRSFGTRAYLERQFGMEFDRMDGVTWPAEPPHPEAAARSIGRVAIRRTRAQVLPEIPAKTYAEVPVDLRGCKVKIPEATTAELEVYKAIDKGGLEVVPMERMEELSRTRALLAEAKIPAMMEFVQRFIDEGVPLVVASYNRAPLDHLQGEAWPVIHGGIDQRYRQEAVDLFQQGRMAVIGIQLQAGGTGITLTAAHHMLVVSRDWSPANNAQAEDRICRIGQKNKCIIYDLLANHPLDEIVFRSVRRKQTRIGCTVEQVGHTLRSGRALERRTRELANLLPGLTAQAARQKVDSPS